MSRKASIIVRCDGDGCKEVGEVAELRETPSGWYSIKQADELGKLKGEGFDFHNLRCVERWAKARRAVLNGGEHSSRGSSAEDQVVDAVRMAVEENGVFTSKDIQGLSGSSQNTVDSYLRSFVERGVLTLTTPEGTIPRIYSDGANWSSL